MCRLLIWCTSMVQSVGPWSLSTFRGGLGSSAANDGIITLIQRWRSLHGLRKRTESSTRPTNGSATAGQRSRSFFLDGKWELWSYVHHFQLRSWNGVMPSWSSHQQDRQLHQEPLELHHEEEGGAWGVPARWLQEFPCFSRWSEATPPQTTTVSSDSHRAPALRSQSPAYARTRSGLLLLWTPQIMLFRSLILCV